MHIIEIAPLDNGAHNNQNGGISTIPTGWAVIPEDMIIPETYPFVDIEVDGQTVIKMTAGVMPDPEPVEEVQTIEDQITDIQEVLLDHEYRLVLTEMGLYE